MNTTNSEFVLEDTPPELPAVAVKQAKTKKAVPEEPKKKSGRVRIVVDEPSDGEIQHFFGINGKGFLIRFGEEVTVPRELLNVLDEAIQTKTIPVAEGGYIERDFKRFTYRIVGE